MTSYALPRGFSRAQKTRRCLNNICFRAAFTCAISATTALGITAAAQSAPSPLPADVRLKARADSLTVGNYCRAARAVLASPAVISGLALKSAAVEISTDIICAPELSGTTLLSLRGDRPATLRSVARINTAQYAELN
ncbi:MAG: hypothetical protein M3Y64_08900, partial [Gemmatimonadota bacterium]|nr:hypothetical protein [Gemmatimonadota bacterium]